MQLDYPFQNAPPPSARNWRVEWCGCGLRLVPGPIGRPDEALATRARFHLSAELQIHTPLFCVDPFEL